jgi:hypothetical protein
VHTRFDPINDVDESSIIHLDVIGLDRNFASFLPIYRQAARFCVRGGGRYVVRNLPGVEGVANVQRSDSRIEIGDKDDSLVIDGSK